MGAGENNYLLVLCSCFFNKVSFNKVLQSCGRYSVYFLYFCLLILRWMYLVLLKLRKWIYLNGFFVMTWEMSRIVREKMQPSMKLIVQIHTFCLFIILKSGKGLYKRLMFHIIRSLEFMKIINFGGPWKEWSHI